MQVTMLAVNNALLTGLLLTTRVPEVQKLQPTGAGGAYPYFLRPFFAPSSAFSEHAPNKSRTRQQQNSKKVIVEIAAAGLFVHSVRPPRNDFCVLRGEDTGAKETSSYRMMLPDVKATVSF
jgi:hypothetical protein